LLINTDPGFTLDIPVVPGLDLRVAVTCMLSVNVRREWRMVKSVQFCRHFSVNFTKCFDAASR